MYRFIVMEHDLYRIVSGFEIEGKIVDVRSYGCGHINDTYVVQAKLPKGNVRRYILQRINQSVFKNPFNVMQNIQAVSAHLRGKIEQEGGDPERETLNLIPVSSGGLALEPTKGELWRMFAFIENTCVANGDNHLHQAAQAFAKFQQRLRDLPIDSIIDTIPGFHDTKARYMALAEATASDPENRALDAKEEITFAQIRANRIFDLTELLDRKTLSFQIIHNDTKLDNVLIDIKTNRALCVIDLDTIMPGPPHFDFGDCVRSGASSASEDEKDLSKIFLDMDRFTSLARGYLEVAKTFLDHQESKYLSDFVWLLTFECGIRFLTDYLLGDRYFKVHRNKHNLDRCRAHFKLLSDMEQKMELMIGVVEKLAR